MQSRVSSPKNILSFVLIGMLTVYKGIPLYLSYLNQYNFMGYILHPRNNLNFSVWNTISTKSKLKNERWSPKKFGVDSKLAYFTRTYVRGFVPTRPLYSDVYHRLCLCLHLCCSAIS